MALAFALAVVASMAAAVRRGDGRAFQRLPGRVVLGWLAVLQLTLPANYIRPAPAPAQLPKMLRSLYPSRNCRAPRQRVLHH